MPETISHMQELYLNPHMSESKTGTQVINVFLKVL
jgi:hypothetical protein